MYTICLLFIIKNIHTLTCIVLVISVLKLSIHIAATSNVYLKRLVCTHYSDFLYFSSEIRIPTKKAKSSTTACAL